MKTLKLLAIAALVAGSLTACLKDKSAEQAPVEQQTMEAAPTEGMPAEATETEAAPAETPAQ